MPEPARQSERAQAGRPRRVGATEVQRRQGKRGQASFAILGLLVIVSLILGLLATGYLASQPANPQGEQPTRGASSLVPTYEARLQGNPNDTDAMIVLANTLQNQGDYAGAIGWYDRAVNLKPDDIDLRLAFGQTLASYGQQNDAEVQYQKALGINPNNAQAEYYLAELYQRWVPPRLAEARQHYQRASDLEPEGAWGRAARAVLNRMNATPTAGTPTP